VLALRSDGTVWAFGDNSGGYLGDGTTDGPRPQPQQVPGLSGITEVVTGGLESFAVRSDGTLFAWGQNTTGSLGLGTTSTNVLTPTPVPGLTGVTQVASNGWGTLAVAGSALRLWAWGSNACGELGDGTTTDRTSPELTSLVGVTQIAMGDVLFLQVSSAAIRYDGTLWTWGCNAYGELGYGSASGYVTTPTQVRTMAQVSQFAFGDDSITFFQPGEFGIAIGSLPATVPSLIGDTTSQASQALQAAGLVLGTVSSVIDYTCENIGTVESQNPGAGTSVNPGTAVSVTIGKAPPPPHQCL
jgi:alpha-tubulin suppressor-like RCC1 family protein